MILTPFSRQKGVIMEKGAVIDASAIKDGDGGKIVLWSDVLNPGSFTTVKGELYAKGGDLGGNGGMIETSGHILAINQAKISTIAPLGNTGMWLLDPGNINITDSAPDPIDDPTLPSFPVSSDTDIHPTSIANALESTGVSIQTGSGNYDITVSSPISYTGSNSHTLTLEAGQDVNLNATVDIGSAGLTINAGRNLDVAATIDSDPFTATVGQDATIGSAIDSDAGTLTINADNDISLSANLTTSNTSDSAIVLHAGKNDAAGTGSGGDISITGSPTISVGGSGRATFYTGSVSGSSGLTSLIGSGSGRFRYNSDESVTNYTTSISSGKYAIFREQPSGTIASMTPSMTYGDPLPSLSATGNVNGDLPTYDIASRTDSATGNINAGSYSIDSSNLANLGYSVTGGPSGTLTVNPKVISLTVAEKVYDASTSLTGLVSITTGVSGGGIIENLSYENAVSNSKNVVTSETKYLSGIDLIDGTNGLASNYTVPTLDRDNSAAVTINPKEVKLSASKVFDGTKYSV
jgi:hypothetical protein